AAAARPAAADAAGVAPHDAAARGEGEERIYEASLTPRRARGRSRAMRWRMRAVRAKRLWIAAIGIVIASVAGCHGNVAPSPRKDVPAGGCPLSHGRACDDPACEAAYACNPDGTWTLDHPCPACDASVAADASDVSAPRDASSIDAPPGASGGP